MKKKKLLTELTFNLQRKKNINRNTVTDNLVSDQKFNEENQVKRPFVAVLVIFNTFSCCGITGGV